MNPILRNVLAVFAGLISGGLLNMLLISISSSVIPPPEGADLTTKDGLIASMHLMEPKHFLMPFLAHAMGTFLGAYVATLIAATHKLPIALVIGFVFLLGGIASIFMLPSPFWFSVVDISFAYIPMALIGYKLATNKT